jgi:uncharacterized RDD family membrane protein YckC
MQEALDTDITIEAPEHIMFLYRVGGPARRAVAHVIDLLLCYGAVALFATGVLFAAGGVGAVSGAVSSMTNLGIGLVLVAVFAAQWLYFAAWEGLTGRTPGKAALRLRVVTTTGRPIGLSNAALRNILRAADVLPNAYGVGLLAMALTRRFQRLGDLVAGTMVIVEAKASIAVPLRLWPVASPEELASLPQEVALDADERVAVELFLRRRGALGGARALELAELIAGAFERRFGYRAADPVRTLAILYDAAANAGRSEGPPSSRVSESFGPPRAGTSDDLRGH